MFRRFLLPLPRSTILHPLFSRNPDPFLRIYLVRPVPNRNLLRSLCNHLHSLPLRNLRGFPFDPHHVLQLSGRNVLHDYDVGDLVHPLSVGVLLDGPIDFLRGLPDWEGRPFLLYAGHLRDMWAGKVFQRRKLIHRVPRLPVG
jgi:hypothetical protein